MKEKRGGFPLLEKTDQDWGKRKQKEYPWFREIPSTEELDFPQRTDVYRSREVRVEGQETVRGSSSPGPRSSSGEGRHPSKRLPLRPSGREREKTSGRGIERERGGKGKEQPPISHPVMALLV